MNKTMNWVFIPITIIVIIVGFMMVGHYNTMQTMLENQKASAAEIINQYKRRADLISNLANTVKGYADHEQSIFTDIAESRAKIGQLQISADDFQDPAKLEAFEKAQQGLNGQLSRLLMITENYPDLKADKAFTQLMVSLEGTENRIAVARNRNIEAVRQYNTMIKTFPYLITAKMLGFETLPQFSVDDPNIDQPPVIAF